MKSNSVILISVLVVAIAVLAYVAYERRSPAQKAGSAIREAGRDLKHAVDPRSPAEKIGDGIKDTAREIKD